MTRRLLFLIVVVLSIALPCVVSSEEHRGICTYDKVKCEGSMDQFSVLVHPEGSFSRSKYVSSRSAFREEYIYIKIAKACSDLGLSSALDIFIDDDIINGMVRSSLASLSSEKEEDKIPCWYDYACDTCRDRSERDAFIEDQEYDQDKCSIVEGDSKGDLNGRAASYYIRRSSRIDLFKYLSIYEKKTKGLSFSQWSPKIGSVAFTPLAISMGLKDYQHEHDQEFDHHSYHQCEIQVYRDAFSRDGYRWRIASFTNLDKWFKLTLRPRNYESSASNINPFSPDGTELSIVSLIRYSRDTIVGALSFVMKSIGIISSNEMDDLSYFFNPRILNDTCRYLIFFEEMKSFADGTRLALESSDGKVKEIIGQFSFKV